MLCPSCQSPNDDTAQVCFTCRNILRATTKGSILGGRYEILECLGRGGMGTVYKAHDRTLDEIVAIKVLQTLMGDAEDLARRFRTEIKLARRVAHKNVCRIHEYGEEDGQRYISMAFVDGVTLRQVLRQMGRLPPGEAYDVAISVAEGLGAIHDEGIVHRDLKTPNIMRDSKGVVKILDFGIAKQTDGTEGLTTTGLIVGTPEYMSPEQAQGRKLDGRSDLYALGIVCYEMFTGEVPFRGDTFADTVNKQVREPVPFDGPLVAALPKALVPVLRRALAKDPVMRFASAKEMAEALAQARDNTPRSLMTGPVVDLATGFTEKPTAAAPRVVPTRASAPRTDRSAAPAAETPEPRAWWPWLLLPVGIVGLFFLLGQLRPRVAPHTPESTAPAAVADEAASAQQTLAPPTSAPATAQPAEAAPPADAPVREATAAPEPRDAAATENPRDEMDRGCQLGRAADCLRLAMMYREGSGANDAATAASYFERACDAGRPEACAQLARQFIEGRGVEPDPQRARAFAQKGCDGGDPWSCHFLRSQDGPPDGGGPRRGDGERPPAPPRR